MPNQNQKGTGFTNIQEIVRSNRNNRLGKTVQSGVGNVIGQGQQQLRGAQQQFQQGAQQNQIGTAADQAYVNQSIQNPTNVQQQDVDRFANLRSGQYRGPTQLGNREELGARGQELQGIAGSATSEQGRRGLLQRFVAPQQQYTQGQQRLDNLLLGQTGGQATRNARQSANQFNQQLLSADQAAQGQGQAYQQQAQQFGQDVNQKLGQAQTDQQKELQDRATQQTKGSEAAKAAIMALFSKPTAGPTRPEGGVSTMPIGGGGSLKRSNITQEQYDAALPILEQAGLANKNIYNPEYFASSPETLLTGLPSTATDQSVATAEDKARAAGLAKLFGKNQEFLTGDVGGYNPMAFLDQNRLQDTLTKSTDAYNETNPYSSLIDKDTNLANIQYLGNQYRPYASQQASGITDLANKLRATDPNKSTQYDKLAGQLGAWGGGRGYLFGGDEGQSYKQQYNDLLSQISGLKGKYGEDTKAISTGTGGSLMERLKSLINPS